MSRHLKKIKDKEMVDISQRRSNTLLPLKKLQQKMKSLVVVFCLRSHEEKKKIYILNFTEAIGYSAQTPCKLNLFCKW
jgi:hypothetical protein